jgi:hypothetical protein
MPCPSQLAPELGGFVTPLCRYMARSVVEENHDSILKNYHAAFRGNRNLANANTDDLFRNRYAILRSMKIDSANQVQKTISCGVLCFSRQYL